MPGAGLVLHTVNPRLYEHQLAYIFTHAAPTVILVDGGFADLLARVLALCGADYAPRAVVVVPDGRPGDDRATRTAEASARGWLEYDALLERRLGEDVAWADDLDETAASGLCYTSGTTGDPKGCLFSHRSTTLHTLFSLTAPSMGLRKADAALPFVPMFHVNAWGLPWAAALAGSKLCLLAGPLDGAVAGSYAADEGVTFAAGVPTVFMALADGLEARRDAALFSADGRVVVGGAATPPALAERYEARGCHVVRSWGMTELSPVGVMGPHRDDGIGRADADAPVAAGFELFGVELRVVDDGGAALPRDGSSQGELEVRGPATIRRYYGAAEDACDADGWFKTGDVATISSTGALAIRDRAKDVVKSGGEWISSAELEGLVRRFETFFWGKASHRRRTRTTRSIRRTARARRSSRRRTTRTASGPCSSRASSRGRRRRSRSCWISTSARSPSGGSPTTSSSSTGRCRSRARARSPSSSSASSCSTTTSSRRSKFRTLRRWWACWATTASRRSKFRRGL